LQNSQGYIIRILQHFATKLWNITNFVMLFQAVMKFLSRSKFSLLRKWSICWLLSENYKELNPSKTFDRRGFGESLSLESKSDQH
jgi:valyl-tRNA synthetase